MSVKSFLRIFGQDTNLELDDIDKYPVFMTEFHHKIHEGKAFTVSKITASIAPSGSMRYFIKPDVVIHPFFNISSGGRAYIRLYKNVKHTTTVGTTITPHNMNGTSTNLSSVGVFHNGVISTSGTLWIESLIPAGGRLQYVIGGSEKKDSEYIMGPTTTYMVQCINKITTSKDMSIEMKYYF